MKNDSINTKNVKNNSEKVARKKMQKVNKKRIQAEANARRRIAKSWALLGKSVKYRKAAAKVSCKRLTHLMEKELFDGIFLNLSERNSKKSHSCQKRILRRIVEKRQAQSAHHLVGRSGNMFAKQLQRYCSSQSLNCLFRYQLCV